MQRNGNDRSYQGNLAKKSLPRIGVLGCGYWGRNLVRAFARLEALAAVGDVDLGRCRELADAYEVAAMEPSELLASPHIDAVAIATPAATHAELALAALDAGKHVFVEKPLALDVGTARKVMERAAARKLVLMVGHVMRYHSAFVKLQEIVEQGVLGKLQYIYSTQLNMGRFRTEENVIWSFAPHDISMVLALTRAEPYHVDAVGHTYLSPGLADVTLTHLTFPNGVAAHIFVSWLHPFKERRLVVVGTDGMAVLDDGQPWDRKLTLYRHRVTWEQGVPAAVRAEGEPVPLQPVEPLVEECRHFLECVRTGGRPRTDGEEGLRVLSVIERADAAMKGDTFVSADPRHHGKEDIFVHPTAVVDEGASIGPGTKIWHFSHIRSGARIGRNVTIGQNVMIDPHVVVGDRCKIQNNVSLYEGVVLEEEVFCGPSCVFTNVINPRAWIERKAEFRTTVVRRGATIGANATIVCGVELGEYCFVGAGAVVTRSVPPYALVVGNPARQIGWVSRAGERLGEDLRCPRTGERYMLVAGRLYPVTTEGARNG